MDGYESNGQCILDYLALFQALSREEEGCGELLRAIRRREVATETALLAPPLLRRQFRLGERDFLLAMAALALEMDGGLRNAFRRKYGLELPTVEYGLQLISPLCPSSCETLAELSGENLLCGLLLAAAPPAAYPLERPLILCRTAVGFLTGLSAAELPGCTPLLGEEERLPIYEEECGRVRAWYARGGEAPLYLCAPAGSGRRTLLRRACGRAVYADMEAVSDQPPAEQDRTLGEAAALAVLLDAPVCAEADRDGRPFRGLERLCRRYGIPLAALAEEERALAGAKEVLRLPRQLSAEGRRRVWDALVPQAAADAVPRGAMTVGAVAETAGLARRLALAEGRRQVTAEDTRRAMLQRGGALEFGVGYQADVSLADMVLSDGVRKQLELICQAALSGGRLAAWGLPRQGEGVTAVFHGPSGTGKTMAASAIAHRLGMPLLRADLSQIMDQYVGETEKHLRRLFLSARENHCVLLFDEADSLFGKRAQVTSGHDKYANLSTSYLLQEIEQYDGIAILSTNLLGSFDDAFLRRLQYIVRFSLPDAGLRERLWRQALPPERCEGELPYASLAQAELSPARILAAARGAVVELLGAEREKVDVSCVIHALRLELEKSNKSLPKALAELTPRPHWKRGRPHGEDPVSCQGGGYV